MVFYHATTLDNYQQIKTQGLIPKFPLYAKAPDRPMIYLSDSQDVARSIFFQRVERGFTDLQPLVILSVLLDEESEIYLDTDTESGGYMTPNPITPDRLVVEYISEPIVSTKTDLF